MQSFAMIRPGARVRFGKSPDLLEGTVVSVHMYPDMSLVYSVAYWAGETRTQVDLHAVELQPEDDADRMRVRFTKENSVNLDLGLQERN